MKIKVRILWTLLGMSLRDRQARTFVEISRENPVATKQIVVPVESESGQILEAVVLEYTPLHSEMTQLMGLISRIPLAYAGFGCLLVGLLIALYRAIRTGGGFMSAHQGSVCFRLH
jgi:hypothetical protein